jgi:hypothetical protein
VQQIVGGTALECMVIAGTSDASEYLLITANAASAQDDETLTASAALPLRPAASCSCRRPQTSKTSLALVPP